MKSKIIIKLIDISLQIPFHFYFKNVKIYFKRYLRYVHEYAKSSYSEYILNNFTDMKLY